jgi:hypothetical protein
VTAPPCPGRPAPDEVHLAIAYNRIIWRAARLTNPDMLPVDLNAEECLDVMEGRRPVRALVSAPPWRVRTCPPSA